MTFQFTDVNHLIVVYYMIIHELFDKVYPMLTVLKLFIFQVANAARMPIPIVEFV